MTTEERVKQLEEELANERTRNERIILELNEQHNNALSQLTVQLTEQHNKAKQEAINQLTDRLTGEHREEIKAMLANFKSDVAERLIQLANNQHEQANRITRALQDEKTILGTKEPNRRLAHWYMLTSEGDENERKVRLTSGQRHYIDSQRDALVTNGGHTLHFERQTGNGIDLRQYVRLNANPRIQAMINPELRNIIARDAKDQCVGYGSMDSGSHLIPSSTSLRKRLKASVKSMESLIPTKRRKMNS